MAVPTVDLRLALKRVFPREPLRVYRFFAEPALLARWWGPRGFNVGSVDFAPRAGGHYRIEMRPPAGDPFYLNGTFVEVEPARQLVFTFRWDPPDPDDVESVADLSFLDFGDATEILMTQGPFKTEERRDLHRHGWGESFDKLERLVAAHGLG